MQPKLSERRTYIGLGVLQAFIGLGALGGGFMLVSDPSGSAMGLAVSMLEGSPFPDFLVPGIFLFAVNGLGSIVGAGSSFARSHYGAEVAIALGVILVTWIVVQVAIIDSVHWPHILYFTLGLVELAIGLSVRRHRTSNDSRT